MLIIGCAGGSVAAAMVSATPPVRCGDHSVVGVITASEPSWIAPFTGLSPRQFKKAVTAVEQGSATTAQRGRPWALGLADRVLLVTAYWRTNLTLRQLALPFGISKSTGDRVVADIGPRLALQPRRRFRRDTVLIVDGTLVPTRDHTVAEQSKNYSFRLRKWCLGEARSQRRYRAQDRAVAVNCKSPPPDSVLGLRRNRLASPLQVGPDGGTCPIHPR